MDSSSSSSSLSVSSQNWIHDVFPSFRGEDVRKDFLSHIQKEFRRKGITPFIDNEIKRGESISPELIRAIRGSKIAIILVSKNYASSKWCLDELVEIMKCREEVGQTVMTIFYKVDPSHVKKLAGNFGKVFRKTCAGKSNEDIERWRQALEKVATIAGYDSSNWDNEAAMIEKIATDVSNELIHSTPSSDFDGLVGMRAHMENMNLFLHLDSNEVKMIGIWGPSGIGKSTIARILYSKYSSQFQLSVFMENIKRRYPRPCFDEYSAKLQLQKEFLSQILNQDDIKIRHLGVAQDRLKHNRVFVVLDDVDQPVQLEAMAKEAGWFGPGSRIIITTQDKKLLTTHRITDIYKVDFPHDKEALEILCMYAFGQKCPYEGFEELAWEVTKLAGKLPLGLRIMGSYLKGRTNQEWIRELPRLKISLDGEIESILKFSYDALSAEDKELFLYIACFFNNEEIERVEAHLANHFSNVSQGLHILAEKSLISLDMFGYIKMHDLLARFGRDIDRKQSNQFVVGARDIWEALNTKTVSGESVIGAVINFSEINKELNRCDNVVESMSCLQFLRVSDNSLPEKVLDWQYFRMKYLPSIFNPYRKTKQILRKLTRKVRLLDWKDYPMSSLPSDFNPEFLVELRLRYSLLEKLWEGKKTITNLKWMDLSYSKNLRKLPDLSTATNLHALELNNCWNLRKLPSSIGNVTNLQRLDLSYCFRLMELPSSIGNVTNLQRLDLSVCLSLIELPSSIGNANNLKELNLLSCSSLRELPSFIGNAINLQRLDLSVCLSLRELPSSIGNAINLEELNLCDCSSLRELPSSIGNAINLKRLDLSHCSSLRELPSSIGNVTNLRVLSISGCKMLVSLPQLPDSLEILIAENCESLEKLHCSFNKTRLVELNFSNCFNLNQEARDLIIIMTSSCDYVILPGEKVPTHFTGNFLSMKLNGIDTSFPRSLRFKACILLVNKGDMKVGDWMNVKVTYCITGKQNGIEVKSSSSLYMWNGSPLLKQHLYTFHVEERVSSSELVFEFEVSNEKLEIAECGILYLEP